MVEVLGKIILKKQLAGEWKGLKIHDDLDACTPSQFSNDTMVFGEASIEEAKCIIRMLDTYLECSSQVMNKEKSQLFFFNPSKQNQLRIAKLMGIKITKLPMKYLGIKIDKGRRQTNIWKDVNIACEAKSASWKNQWLSQAGKITMVQSVLSAISIYNMSCFRMPSSIRRNLDSLLRKFIWEGAKDVKRIPLISWDTMCLEKEEGGARLRKMDLQNMALGAKLTWKMYREPRKLWFKIFKKKSIITDHLSWHIGNEQSAKFWHDSWEGQPALSDLILDKAWIQSVEEQIGSFVSDYFDCNPSNGVTCCWK
ncbi:uncharacterized protein LOC131875706 [Cryptomeria japonica]|uniref:uncharacterized protein LOC131875706 n=1 Tax=Cryptomeria japonica TaxID=3369 RepID=UPI0027DA9C37|nr:uncharacterized protein LOC131875706 [Cryptomeria japonica]